jgi:hypothetical protein
MKRFMQIVLGINVALVAVIDLLGYTFHVGPVGRVAAAEPIVSRQYAAVALGYAVILVFVVWQRFAHDPAWLLVPAITLSALWLDAVYELAAGGLPVSEALPPTIIRLVLVGCFVSGYVVLRRRGRDHAATTANAISSKGAGATS